MGTAIIHHGSGGVVAGGGLRGGLLLLVAAGQFHHLEDGERNLRPLARPHSLASVLYTAPCLLSTFHPSLVSKIISGRIMYSLLAYLFITYKLLLFSK